MIKPKKIPSPTFLVIILTLMAGFGPLSVDLYLPAFLQIQENLSATPTEVKHTLTSFLVGICLGMMFYGSLSDKYGRRNVILIGAVIYFFTSILGAYASTVENLIIARFFQAIGAGACMVVGRAIIRDVFSGKKVAMMMSVVQVVLMTAPLAAPFIGVQILKIFDSWRALFFVLSGFGVLVFFSVFCFLPETYKKEDRQEISILGTFNNYIKILIKRDSLGSILACAFPSGAIFAFVTGSSYLYQSKYGLSPEMFSFLFGLNIVGVIISALLNILLLKRFSTSFLIMFGLVWMSIAGIFAIIFGSHSLIGFVISIFSIMCVTGFVGNNLASKLIELNYHKAGAAMALNSASQFFIGAITSFIVGHIENSLAYVIGFCGILAFISYYFLVVMYEKKHL